jgi:hypothetical protein
MTIEKRGADLVVGDVIEVWGPATVYRITAFTPYIGPLAHLWPEGVRIAQLAGPHLQGVTVGGDSRWTVYD